MNTIKDLQDVQISNSQDVTQVRPDIGFSDEDRTLVVGALRKVLADSYCFMLTCQNYHWNVRGQHFKQVHELTEAQYEDLFGAIDEIAERIRALGHLAPGTLHEFNDLTTLNMPDAQLGEKEMIAELLKGNEALSKTLKNSRKIAEEIEDEVTVDMLIERTKTHEKTAWMYRSMLEK